MKFKSLILIVITSFIIYACKSADSQVPAMSTDMCNCFKTIEEAMTPEMKVVFKEAGNSSDPQAKLMEGMRKLSPEQANEIGKQLTSVGNSSSPVGICMKELEKKYDKMFTKDKEAVMDKIVKELSSKEGCNVSAAILSIGVQKQRKK